MAESRDLLSKPMDVAAVYARRCLGVIEVYQDQPNLERARRVQVGRGRNMFQTPTPSRVNRRGSVRRGGGRGRATNSGLPSWYPRTPLRDITAIIRAYERRRVSLGRNRAQEIESPLPQAHGVDDSAELSPVVAHLEQSTMNTPDTSTAIKSCRVGSVSKILLAVTNKPSESSEFLTPQKKLLNAIDIVEKEVMEELQKQTRRTSAKRAEREEKGSLELERALKFLIVCLAILAEGTRQLKVL